MLDMHINLEIIPTYILVIIKVVRNLAFKSERTGYLGTFYTYRKNSREDKTLLIKLKRDRANAVLPFRGRKNSYDLPNLEKKFHKNLLD